MTNPISLGSHLGAGLRRAAAGRDDTGAAAGQTQAQPSSQPSGGLDGAGTGGARGVLAALLNRLSVGGADGPAAPVEAPGAVQDAGADDAPRPNLDALNRVLNHYAAQSAAATLPFRVLET
ncbi:MAG: hypothetical protein INR70_42360 [Parafilimonas terrae]|nr:hypothetical protein [Parafilimonas terrae]